MTRTQFAIMLVRALGLAPVTEPRLAFADAAAIPDWAAPEVAAAVEVGLIGGYPDGTFRPDEPISRTEIAATVTRALAHRFVFVPPADVTFGDAGQVPAWARDVVGTAVAAGLVGSYPDGTFRPDETANRAEAVVVKEPQISVV